MSPSDSATALSELLDSVGRDWKPYLAVRAVGSEIALRKGASRGLFTRRFGASVAGPGFAGFGIVALAGIFIDRGGGTR